MLLEKNGKDKHVRNEGVLHIDREERNILQTINGRKANCIGHILSRNCFLKNVTEGKVEGRIKVKG
jgi:hypothetical protein